MPSYVTPKKNTAYVFYVSFVSQANTKIMQANPTIAAGDITASTDGAASANLATLPVVTPAGSRRVKISLSSGEMNGDNVSIMCSDVSGAEWCDLHIVLQTTANQVDDLATSASITTLQADTDDIQTRLPTALVAGRMSSSVGAMATDVLDANALKADAVTEIQSGLSTLTAAGVRTAVGLATANLDTQLDALPTNAELTAALGTADDATLAAIAALNNISTAQVKTQADQALADAGVTVTVTGRIDAAISTRASQTSVDTVDDFLDTEIAAIKAKTDNLPANTTTTLATLQTSVDDIPTNAELATSQAAADDATLAAIAAISAPTVADILAGVVEGSITVKGALRLMLSVLAGKSSGGGSATLTFRDVADAKARVTATVTADGNRTAITRDITD